MAMQLQDLIDTTLYSHSLEEAVLAIKTALASGDQYQITAGVRGLGHLARRYEYRNDELIEMARQRYGEFVRDECLAGALGDLQDDLDQFTPVIS